MIVGRRFLLLIAGSTAVVGCNLLTEREYSTSDGATYGLGLRDKFSKTAQS